MRNLPLDLSRFLSKSDSSIHPSDKIIRSWLFRLKYDFGNHFPCHFNIIWEVKVLYLMLRRRTRNRRTVFPMPPGMRMPGSSWLTRPLEACGCLWAGRWRSCSVSDHSSCVQYSVLIPIPYDQGSVQGYSVPSGVQHWNTNWLLSIMGMLFNNTQ